MPRVTALRKYERLESPGLWRDHPDAQRREVVVALREATLVLTDPRSEMPLSQWSLPAVSRLNPGETPALYAPSLDERAETLEIEDRDMIAALDQLKTVLERRKPHPGRLRNVILAGSALAIVGIVVFWLPGQFASHAATLLPEPTRAELGSAALTDLTRLSGSACRSVPGRRAATVLAQRLFPDDPPQIEVLRTGLSHPADLPGNILLLPADLVKAATGPEVLAGHLLAQDLIAAAHDPVRPILDYMGLFATIRLLATGQPVAGALDGYGQTLATRPAPPRPDDQAMLAAFAAARVSSSPWAYSLDASGETTLPLIEADPFAREPAERILSDETWLELQAICTE